jgi:hypothetical protein
MHDGSPFLKQIYFIIARYSQRINTAKAIFSYRIAHEESRLKYCLHKMRLNNHHAML